MKKHLLVATAVFITTLAFGQKKQISKQSELQSVKSSAIKWFKSIYVAGNFKDPYSYKLLKAEIIAITNKEAIEKIKSDTELSLSSADTTKFYSDYANKRQAYRKAVSDLKYYPGLYKQSDVDYAKKAWDYELVKYQKLENDKTNAEDLLSKMDVITAKKINYYAVYIDCYSNNSYGNPVLGKFCFYFNKTGLVREPIQLNRED